MAKPANKLLATRLPAFMKKRAARMVKPTALRASLAGVAPTLQHEQPVKEEETADDVTETPTENPTA